VLLNRTEDPDAHLVIRKEMLEELDTNREHYLKYV
jgi:hypothetical protein